MVFRCRQKVVLQWIRNALEEAKSDFREVGRPLTFTVHDGSYVSLLSDGLNNRGKEVAMGGIVNLLIMLLVLTNVKNVLISLQDHGFTLR
jgi:hypothetical protein